MVWQEAERNEWDVSIRRALETDVAMPAASPAEPNPFSLADLNTIKVNLDASGLADITFTDVQEPVYYGADVAAALDWVCAFWSVKDVTVAHGTGRSGAWALLPWYETRPVHHTGRGVWFGSRSWIVTAHRR